MLVLFEPAFDGFAVMDSEVIDYQIDLSLEELDHLAQEPQKNVRVEGFGQRNPIHLAMLVYRTDQTRMIALPPAIQRGLMHSNFLRDQGLAFTLLQATDCLPAYLFLSLWAKGSCVSIFNAIILGTPCTNL